MATRDSSLGCSGLLRVAGLPIRFWLMAANPALFRRVARLDRVEQERRALAIHLAERIGQQLVPNPALSRDDRAFLLALRRVLHRGDLMTAHIRERVLKISGFSDRDEELIRAVAGLVDRDREVAMFVAEVDAEVAREEERLLLLPEQIVRESRVAQALFSQDELAEWSGNAHLSQKKRRHRFEQEWHRVERAATGSTPRDWFSHVALLAIETTAATPTVSEHFTAQWTENVRTRRLALTDPPDDWPSPDSRLSMNPLHWDSGEQLITVALGRNEEQTHVSVRHTPLLDAICDALAGAAPTFGELAHALGYGQQEERIALQQFVRHLVVLGILQPSASPVVRLERQATPGRTFVHLVNNAPNPAGWVDVYRYAERGISKQLVLDVQRGASLALRILNVMREADSDAGRQPIHHADHSWSFSEILKAEFDPGTKPGATEADRERADEWSPSTSPDSGYARLLQKIVERAAGGTEIVIDAQLLDECGANDVRLNWPVDCLVRVPVPGSGYTAVLDQIWPPGTLDARFADALFEQHGVVPHVEAYRAFLRRLEQLTGVLFVELLAPPLTDGAANAVRRPAYTRAWTGDPDSATYLPCGPGPGRYIPLDAIRIRRVDGKLRAEVGGQPIWPVHHATRSFSPPWDRLARVLLATAPVELPWDYQRVIRSLTRLPELHTVPRILVSGGIVLSPALWRLSTEQLWERSAPLPAKLSALVRLQSRHALPRWVFIIPADQKSAVPCDLESIQAIRAIERHATDIEELALTEMLPAPDQLLVVDRAHNCGDRLASQLQLRFPCDESPAAMASRIAPAVRAAFGLPELMLDDSGATSGCRGPPAICAHQMADPRRHKRFT